MNRIPWLLRREGRLWMTFLLAAGFVLASPGAHAEPSQNADSLRGDSEKGKTFYVNYGCYACHGYTGETGTGRLNPPRLNQTGFIAFVRNPTNPGQMPPYQQREVSNQDLADIYAFLTSLPSGSPEIESIPLLQSILEESSN